MISSPVKNWGKVLRSMFLMHFFFWMRNYEKRKSDFFFQYQSLIYVRPQYRIGPYLVGLITGYILATGERPERKNNSESASKRFMFVGWILSVIGGLWSIYGLIPALQVIISFQYYWRLYLGCHLHKFNDRP